MKSCPECTLSDSVSMHRFKRLITAILLTVLSIILLFSAAFVYLIVTPLGGRIFVKYFKQEFSSIGLMHIGHYAGSLHEGLILKDVRITGLSYLPDALLRIQEIHVRIPLWDLPHSDFGIFNARIFIPDCEPIVFTGDVSAGLIKGNLYSKSVDLHAASRFWALEDIRKNLQGFISNVDVIIHGPLDAPQISGTFLADSIRYKSILLTNGVSEVELTLIPNTSQVLVTGEIIVGSGLVNVRQINLKLSTSKIIYQGDIFNPSLDIHLGSRVEDMDIHLTIKGNTLGPQLTVTSDPPMVPQDALQILFTGNEWSAVGASPFNGVTSSELAQDFLNYSLKDINDTQQLGLKTKLTDNLKLGVEMDQLPAPPGDTAVYYSRKIEGEMDLSEHMSLNVAREVLPQQRDLSQGAQDAEPQAETQIYVQYKKRF